MAKTFKPDWTQLTLTIPISASPERVFFCWTKPNQLTRWFLAQTRIDLRPGGSYSWRWNTGTPDTGKILSVRRPSKLPFFFDRASICDIRISKNGKGSLLTLHQHHIPGSEQAKYRVHLGCKAG